MANEELIYRITRTVYDALGSIADEATVEQLVTDVYRVVEPALKSKDAAQPANTPAKFSFSESASGEGSANRIIISVFGVDHPGIVAGVSSHRRDDFQGFSI